MFAALKDKFYDEAELDGMVKHDYHTMFAGIPHIQIVEATNRCEDEGDGEDRDEDTTFADFVLGALVQQPLLQASSPLLLIIPCAYKMTRGHGK
eukprot:SAG31_NODE_48_length_30945_cov_16.254263_26_plen_94_part_00